MDLDEHESTVVGKAIVSDDGISETNTAEGLDRVGVQLRSGNSLVSLT